MGKYYVEMEIDFSGEIEADSKEQAEELAWTGWGESVTADITYDNVASIRVEELDDEEDEDEDAE